MTLTHDEKVKAYEAVQAGRITREEYDYLLGHDKKDLGLAIAVAMLGIVVAGLFLLPGTGITGFIVLEWNETVYMNDTIVDLGVSDIVSLKVSGVHSSGAVTINALIGNESHLVYSHAFVPPKIWTNKTSYALNETIDLWVNMTNYTLWLDDGNKTPVTEPLRIISPGEYTIEALGSSKLSISVTVRNDTDENIVEERIIGPTIFVDECRETCVLAPNGPVTLEILVDGVVSITDVLAESQNTAPILTTPIPDMTIEDSITINLSEHFTDDDELFYEMNNLIGLVEKVDGSLLTIEATMPGTYQATVYASDLQALATAEFTITVPGAEPVNVVTNETVSNETTGAANETVNTPPGQNNRPVAGCDHPNVNKRPPECFAAEFGDAFSAIVAPLVDRNGGEVGRFTHVGNLVINGQLIEQSTESPGRNDFVLGYTESTEFTEEFIPTAWVDSNGNLHLHGRAYEERLTIEAPTIGTFLINNKHGITLAYIDERTGDLFLRGNVVSKQ